MSGSSWFQRRISQKSIFQSNDNKLEAMRCGLKLPLDELVE
nr:4429_t:CDS:2 [Entrophospora candida]